MRALIAALTLSLILGTTQGEGYQDAAATRLADSPVAGAEDATRGDWRWETCRFARADGRPGFSVDEVKLTLRCAARRWRASLDLGFAIVGCESRFVATAQNSRSSAGGVWQALDDTWHGWKARFAAFMDRWRLRGEKLNGRANAVLGWRIFAADGTGLWRSSQWCWG